MIREKDILSAISEFFVRLTTNQYIDGILTFRNDLKIRQSKKLHFVNDTDVTNATIEYDSSVNKVKINKPTQVNGADVLTTNDVDSDLSSSSVKPVQNKTIKNALDSKSDKSTVTDLTGRVSALEQGSLTIDTSFSSYDELSMEALFNAGMPSNKIYLIPSENTEDDDIYDEYIVKDGELELIGNRILSLDDYLEIGNFSSTLYNKVSLDCVTTHKGVNGATEDSLIIKFNIND